MINADKTGKAEVKVGSRVAFASRVGNYGRLKLGTVEFAGALSGPIYIRTDGSRMTSRSADELVVLPAFNNTPTVVCVVVPLPGGGLIAVRRATEPGKGRLALPGGYQMQGETWQQAGAREVLEETGFVVPEPDAMELLSLETDEYGNNLLIAECLLPEEYKVVEPETPAEVLDLVQVTWAADHEWAFPRHLEAAERWLDSI